jgi:ribosome maturation factor RimP
MDVEALVGPVVEAAGMELVEVVVARERGRRILRVTVDREGGVDLDAISELAERLSRRLDLEGYDPGAGPYALEVSSPGLERPLRSPRDFQRRIGQRVAVRTKEAVDGARSHEGALVSADGEAIVLAAAGGERRIPYGEIRSARTVVDWESELRSRK